MRSMTGFGTHHEKTADYEVQVTVKSVNGRFLDIKPHLPRLYQSEENRIKKAVKGTLLRGTVDVYIHRRSLKSAQSEIAFNPGAAKEWMSAYKKLSKTLNLSDEIQLQDIASLPEVFSVMDVKTVSDKEKKVLDAALSKAIVLAQKERVREGKALKADVVKSLKALTDSLKIIKTLSGKMKTKIQERLESRLQNLLKQEDLDPQRQAQEVAILVDKSDIKEEIVRLDEHLRHFKELLKSEVSVGKKLDFYCQELLREFNTIGSKSVFAELTAEVLNAKSGVESLREQVQNIE